MARKTLSIRDRNRRNIIDAAIQEFAAQGFNGSTIQAIADRAGLPKPNVHYYFGNKSRLYREVLEHILGLWDSTLDELTVDQDPEQFFRTYIENKINFSRDYPEASRIFALEVLQGAPRLKEFFATSYRDWFCDRTAVFKQWAEQGRINREISAEHLLFMIWAGTQHYADYQFQVKAALGLRRLTRSDYAQGQETLTTMVLAAIKP